MLMCLLLYKVMIHFSLVQGNMDRPGRICWGDSIKVLPPGALLQKVATFSLLVYLHASAKTTFKQFVQPRLAQRGLVAGRLV